MSCQVSEGYAEVFLLAARGPGSASSALWARQPLGNSVTRNALNTIIMLRI
jgi:hypothetical protein